ncbi:hypothetical protein AYI69_g934 [Smittium culicis]|uniref:Uncharacterized protein n=1 Tax=Smittium culicis TaxID=133412 RepID=A0A1R1YRN6_9FUNG|nr:hypothetical protein AYI69_g934 [Smittium culicis]
MMYLSKFALLAISLAEAKKLNDFGKSFPGLERYSDGQDLSNSINQIDHLLNEPDKHIEYSTDKNQDFIHNETDNDILGLIDDKNLNESENFDTNEDVSAVNDSEKNYVNQNISGAEGGESGSSSVEELLKSMQTQRSCSSNNQKNNELQPEESCGNNECNKKVVIIKKFVPVPMMGGYNIHYGNQRNHPNFGFGLDQQRNGHGFIDYTNSGKHNHGYIKPNYGKNCDKDYHRVNVDCRKDKYKGRCQHFEIPNIKPKYMACDAGIVRKIENMLRRIPSGGDYNSPGSPRCYPSGNFAALRFKDIEGPLKQLSNAGKTGNTGSMAIAIRSGMGGLQKGPNRVAEFFSVFNDGMRKYAAHMKKQMVKGSREIGDIHTKNGNIL